MLSPRQEEIINKAILIIDEKGIQGLTIKNIAKAINTSEPAIYRHFDSKLDILCTILNGFKENIAQNAYIISQNKANPFDKMQLFYENILNRFVKNPSLISVIFSEEIFQNDTQLAKKVMDIQQLNEDIVRDLLENLKKTKQIPESTDIDIFLLLFFGSLRHLVRQWKFGGHNFDLVEKGRILFAEMIQPLKK
ncbi:MAG: TetR/AcrR family transcriptional regulator [Paludibacteraceae bacterium]|nr:TetR/AcrR family transcriptional regulator [Paludibacteraceae bacterium]